METKFSKQKRQRFYEPKIELVLFNNVDILTTSLDSTDNFWWFGDKDLWR